VEYAPAPFTPEQIREACRGRRQRIVTESAGGEPDVAVTEYLDATADDVLIRSTDAAGNVTEARAGWSELRDHAAHFPAAATEIGPDTITIPLGTLDTVRYTVTGADAVHEFWFAPAMPGMPVQYRTLRDGAVISTTTIVDDTAAP